jgi:hypothetical protein
MSNKLEAIARAICTADLALFIDIPSLESAVEDGWRMFLPDAASIIPFLTAERELGRVEGARAMQEVAAGHAIRVGADAIADEIDSFDPAEIVKDL